jgi:hypothetical protein
LAKKLEADTVREIAGRAYTDAIEILALIEVLEVGNKPEISENINRANAGRAAQRIKDSLFTRLHMLVARAYARSREGDRHLRRAFDLLEDGKVLHAVATSETKAQLADALILWRRCVSDHRLEAFLHFRDKYLAHLGVPKDGIPVPIVKDVFDIARATASAAEKLAHATGATSIDLNTQLRAFTESAIKFWHPWTKRQQS